MMKANSRLAVVEDFVTSNDRLIRSVNICTSSGRTSCSITGLLEISCETDSEQTDQNIIDGHDLIDADAEQFSK